MTTQTAVVRLMIGRSEDDFQGPSAAYNVNDFTSMEEYQSFFALYRSKLLEVVRAIAHNRPKLVRSRMKLLLAMLTVLGLGYRICGQQAARGHASGPKLRRPLAVAQFLGRSGRVLGGGHVRCLSNRRLLQSP